MFLFKGFISKVFPAGTKESPSQVQSAHIVSSAVSTASPVQFSV
uniref:Uncharacterized protein n=1 Tax=Anguilla anguilla TaxID=7936 RepID=A0A0E9WIU2_ANGAN